MNEQSLSVTGLVSGHNQGFLHFTLSLLHLLGVVVMSGSLSVN